MEYAARRTEFSSVGCGVLPALRCMHKYDDGGVGGRGAFPAMSAISYLCFPAAALTVGSGTLTSTL